jgi:hypothetical protein
MPHIDDGSARPVTPPVSYAVAWHREAGPRLVGSATVEGDALVLLGRAPGAQDGEARVVLTAAGVDDVELCRSSALPAISARHDGRRVVIELLIGGWGAAHQLADTLARSLTPPPTPSERVCTMAIAARIVPGRRADLEHVLERGLPPELAADGVRCRQIVLGDDDLVIVLTAPETVAQRLRDDGLGLGGTISSPRPLALTFSWARGVPLSPVSR